MVLHDERVAGITSCSHVQLGLPALVGAGRSTQDRSMEENPEFQPQRTASDASVESDVGEITGQLPEQVHLADRDRLIDRLERALEARRRRSL